MIAAQYHKEIGNHRGLSLFVEIHHTVFLQTFESHFNHADRAVDNHLARVNDRGRLLPLQHDRSDFGSISKICDSGFQYFQSGVLNLLLDHTPDSLRDDCRGTAQASVVRFPVPCRVDSRRYIVWVDLDDVSDSGVNLQRKVFLVVIYIEYRFRGVVNLPHDRDADFHRITQNIVDFLPRIVERHDLERDLLINVRPAHLLRVSGNQNFLSDTLIPDIAALTKPRRGCRIHRRAERIDIIESFSLECSDIIAEQREDERFIRLQYLKAEKRKPTRAHPDESGQKQRQPRFIRASQPDSLHKQYNSKRVQPDQQNKKQHTVFPGR